MTGRMAIAERARMFKAGRVFDLEQPRTAQMPVHPSHLPGYSYLLHRHHEDEYDPKEAGPRTSASGVIVSMEHTGTHIDALCHQAEGLELYGAVPVDKDVQTPRGFVRLGVEEIPPIVVPGVLLDVAASKGVESLEPGYAITAEDLEVCSGEQGLEVEPGSVTLVRTGNGRFWDEPERYLAGPGAVASASYWLAERGVVAVGADNMAWDLPEVWDSELGVRLPGHLILLVRHGIYIIENLQLEELAAAKAYSFTFVCTPLKFVGATGSPVRPLALLLPSRNGLDSNSAISGGNLYVRQIRSFGLQSDRT
jgi:kynurenine formamidase